MILLRRILKGLALACLVLILPLAEKTGEALFHTTLLFSARAEEAESMPRREWTVMFYLCGSDLESRHSCATETCGRLPVAIRTR